MRSILEGRPPTQSGSSSRLYTGFDLLETNLWVASEFIFHSGKILYDDVTMEDPDERAAHVCQTDSLCSEIPPFSLERWDFWQKRLIEFSADAEKFGLSSALTVRLTDAVRRMDVIKAGEN